MNIKQIIDKIPKEADVQLNEYPVADRLIECESNYYKLIEEAIQIGSKEPISGEEAVSEVFDVVYGSNVFTRTIFDVPIVRVDYKSSATADRWCRVDEDPSRKISSFCYGDTKFFADEKRIFVEDSLDGQIRVTYARGDIENPFTQANYDLPDDWPSPTWLPKEFHDLLWLIPALRQAAFYKKDRETQLRNELNELKRLFRNHYLRNSASRSSFRTNRGDRHGTNYR